MRSIYRFIFCILLRADIVVIVIKYIENLTFLKNYDKLFFSSVIEIENKFYIYI